MFKRIRNNFVAIMAGLSLAIVPMAMPAFASAAAAPTIGSCLAQGANLDATGAGGDCNGSTADTQAGASKINDIVKTIINVFSLIVGIVAVIMIVFGGFRYITSGGDSGNVSSAKNTIIYAIIGLVIVALAQFIVQFVLNKVAVNN